jgi:hypothetical protein
MLFTGGEIKHDPSCIFYPESLSKLYDDLKSNTYTGAVAFIHWLLKSNYYVSDDKTVYKLNRKEGGISLDEAYKLFNPSAVVPQAKYPFIEKHLTRIKELQAPYAEIYKSVQTVPQAAGPVWVKVTPDKILSNKIIRNIYTKIVYRHYLNHDLTTAYFEGINDDIYIPLSELEYLDESGQQVFTREDMQNSFEAALRLMDSGYPWPLVFDEYMNTNYPTSK